MEFNITNETINELSKGMAKQVLTEYKLNTLLDIILDNTFLAYDNELKIENEGKDKIITAVKYLCSEEYNERRGALISDRIKEEKEREARDNG